MSNICENKNNCIVPNKEELTEINSNDFNNTTEKKPCQIFWSEDPNVLLRQNCVFEFFPTESMTYEQKLNAITRLVILLTMVGFALTKNIRLLIVSVITIGSIYLLHTYQLREKEKKEYQKSSLAEGFSGVVKETLHQNGENLHSGIFDQPTAENPFSNVLMTDYDYNPHKKPAPPSFNENVNNTILDQAKQLVINANPDQPDIADKLFKDLGEQLEFEQSMRQFVSNPSTTIPNDQTGFAEFCYGSMISCKEGNLFACARNLSRHTN
jgi:hypothetical protein